MKKRDSHNIDKPIGLGLFLGRLEERIKIWEEHFENHLSKHKWDRLLQGIYWLSLVLLFVYLKWVA
jgi:hypothetical protein